MAHACCTQTSGSTSQRIASPASETANRRSPSGVKPCRHPGVRQARKRRADRLLRADVPEPDRAVVVRGGQGAAVRGEGQPQSLCPAAQGQRLPHPTPAVGRPNESAAVDLAADEQAAVGGEGDRADLALGAQPGEPLAAAGVANVDAVGLPSRNRAPNGIASCEPSGLKASPIAPPNPVTA